MEAIQFFTKLFMITGWISFILLFLSPICLSLYVTTFAKSTEEFSGVPYVAALFYSLLWVWGGLFVIPISTEKTSMFVIAAAFEAVYVTIFIIYAPKREKAKILGLVALLFTILFYVALVGQFALHGSAARDRWFGITLIFYSTLLFGSPLTIMGTVIRTKSVYYFVTLVIKKKKKRVCITCHSHCLSLGSCLPPLGSSLAYVPFLDPFFSVANAIGWALGALQLILYYKFFRGDAAKEEEPAARVGGSVTSVKLELELGDATKEEEPTALVGSSVTSVELELEMVLPS